jgi:hypothetical protein
MTNLRVFETPEKRLLVEITSHQSELPRALFVRAWFEPPSFIEISPNEVLELSLQGKRLFVHFLDVTSRPRSDIFDQMHLIGALSETDSFTILDRIREILAYS